MPRSKGITFLIVAAQNFAGANTLTFGLVAVLVLLLILMPTARQFGGRVQAPAVPAAPAGS